MNDPELQKILSKLADQTRPPASLVENVMSRIERAPASASVLRRRLLRRFALAACLLVAVGVVILATIHHGNGTQSLRKSSLALIPSSNPSPPVARSFPTLAEYRRAYAESPQALDALLRQQSISAQGNSAPPLRAADAFRPGFNLY